MIHAKHASPHAHAHARHAPWRRPTCAWRADSGLASNHRASYPRTAPSRWLGWGDLFPVPRPPDRSSTIWEWTLAGELWRVRQETILSACDGNLITQLPSTASRKYTGVNLGKNSLSADLSWVPPSHPIMIPYGVPLQSRLLYRRSSQEWGLRFILAIEPLRDLDRSFCSLATSTATTTVVQQSRSRSRGHVFLVAVRHSAVQRLSSASWGGTLPAWSGRKLPGWRGGGRFGPRAGVMCGKRGLFLAPTRKAKLLEHWIR